MTVAIRATDLREGELALTHDGHVVTVIEIRMASMGKIVLARVRYEDGTERAGFATAFEPLL